jgi:hypothetical protein
MTYSTALYSSLECLAPMTPIFLLIILIGIILGIIFSLIDLKNKKEVIEDGDKNKNGQRELENTN